MKASSRMTGDAPARNRSRGDRFGSAAVAIGLVVSAAVVWQSSQASFSATTSNGVNSWTAGKVTLTNNRGSAMFTSSLMTPGAQPAQCIDVSYQGDINGTVRLYTAGLAETPDIDDAMDIADLLTMQVDIGAAGATCAAPATWTELTDPSARPSLKTLSTNVSDFATGLGVWQPTASTDRARAYRFTPTLADDNRAQGDRVELTFVWEVQNS